MDDPPPIAMQGADARGLTPLRATQAFVAGAAVGVLGGLIGLGGAEFRLPLLIGLFQLPALEAVILNKAMSLVVVVTALPARTGAVPFSEIIANWPIVANLLVGSLLGAWFGAGWAIGLRGPRLYRVIAVLLVLIAVVLVFGHGIGDGARSPIVDGLPQIALAVVLGFGIGVVASLLGVAGGELLIPTIILVFGCDLKLAGSLSLAVSLPTMIVGFARYSRDRSFSILRSRWSFALTMAAGSVAGSYLGGLLLGVVPQSVLLPALAAILLLSAAKVWRHA